MIFIIDWLMVILWEEDAFFYHSSAWLLTQYQWNVQKGSSMLLVVVLQTQQAVHENTHLQQPHLSSPKYSQGLHCCDSSPSLSPLHFNLFFLSCFISNVISLSPFLSSLQTWSFLSASVWRLKLGHSMSVRRILMRGKLSLNLTKLSFFWQRWQLTSLS